MTHSRRTALVALAASCVAAPAFAQAQTTPVVLRVGTQANEPGLPLVYAMRAGLFERAGISIEFQKMTSGAHAAAALAGGAIDIGSTSLLALILGHAKGLPFTIVAPSGILQATSEAGLLALASSTLRSAKDFVGKTVAPGAVNDINYLSMRNWMDQNGADSSTIKVLEMSQVAAVAALEQGRVDGICVVNPSYTLATSGGKARPVANIYTAVAPRLLLVAWFSTTGWVERNRAVAQRFARVLADAATYVNGHAAETVDDLVTLTGLERPLLAKMRAPSRSRRWCRPRFRPLIDVAAKYKAIDRSYPAAELISDVALR